MRSSAKANGPVSYSATATDAAGNVSSPALFAVIIDNVVPSRPASLLLAPETDSGTKLDNITNIALPTISGTGEERAVVTLVVARP